MCLIISADKKQPIPPYILESAAQKNSDGWGAIWHEAGKTRVKRSLDMSKLHKFAKIIEKFPRVIHLRMATHGTANLANCHPFQIRDGLYFVHNGVMNEYGTLKDDKSDTAIFNETIIKPLARMYSGDDLLTEVWFRHAMEKFAGTSQRFAFMDKNGQMLRVGSWTQHKGLWLSNSYSWTCPYDSARNSIGDFYGNWRSNLGNTTTQKPYEKPTIYDYRKTKHYEDLWRTNVKKALAQIEQEEEEEEVGKQESGENDFEVEFTPEVQEIIDAAVENADSPEEFGFEDLKALPTQDLAEALANSPEFCAQIIKNAR